MPVPERKSYHHRDLRNALISAAIPVLKEKGVMGLGMRELATLTGVSHGAPYRHFSDKTALLEAIAAQGYRQVSALCNSAREKYRQQPLQALEEAGIGYLRFVVDNPEIANLMFSGVLSPVRRGSELGEAAACAERDLLLIIELGKQAGLYAGFDNNDLTTAFLSMMHGLSMLLAGDLLPGQQRDERSVRVLGRTVAAILLNGMLRRGAGNGER
ncbi:MAG TPA: TetR/AcrR family transcriptional regulator [Gammaproteobacteria bacterium]|nr:TetR/AcrR family transcriptional regulator [Gammaproteobacteria bacterium]